MTEGAVSPIERERERARLEPALGDRRVMGGDVGITRVVYDNSSLDRLTVRREGAEDEPTDFRDMDRCTWRRKTTNVAWIPCGTCAKSRSREDACGEVTTECGRWAPRTGA